MARLSWRRWKDDTIEREGRLHRHNRILTIMAKILISAYAWYTILISIFFIILHVDPSYIWEKRFSTHYNGILLFLYIILKL